jgi:AcrR family transcriptional regulator
VDGDDTPLTQEQRKLRTRAALMEAASEVFARKGFGGAGVEEIAECAHLTTGALYAHFENKQALFLAVFDEFAVQRVRDVELSTATDLPGEISPRAGADPWMRQLDQSPWRFWLHLEFAHYAARDPELKERFALSVGAVRSTISRLIEQHANARGLELPVSAEWLGTVIRALGMGLSLERLGDPDAVPLEMFGEAVELILGLVESAATRQQFNEPAHA